MYPYRPSSYKENISLVCSHLSSDTDLWHSRTTETDGRCMLAGKNKPVKPQRDIKHEMRGQIQRIQRHGEEKSTVLQEGIIYMRFAPSTGKK